MQLEAMTTRSIVRSPLAKLTVALLVAIALQFAPRAVSETARNLWREVLRPGQLLLSSASELARRSENALNAGGVDANPLKEQISRLTEQVRQLQTELLMADAADGERDAVKSKNHLPPLLITQTVVARVLGRQSRAFLASREMLDVGKTRGVSATSLVIDKPANPRANESKKITREDSALVDQGRDAEIATGRLVLAGSRVWGKIAEVGLHTSTVQRVTDAGYRDLVQLTTHQDGRLQFAARGMLVGQGAALCKIELVEATAPVTVGDLVYTASDGALDVPLMYGRVSRLERKAGDAHWEIWMEPAVALTSPPNEVAVLKTELNPGRFAAGR
jgi:cell shape-determining protein MreC